MSISSSAARLPRNMSSAYSGEGHPLPFTLFLTAALLSTILKHQQGGRCVGVAQMSTGSPSSPSNEQITPAILTGCLETIYLSQ